jgi:hypothetical protein
MERTQTHPDADERLGDALDRLLAALGDVADACPDDEPEAVARRIAATVYLDEPHRRAVRWTKRLLAALEAS